MCGKVITFSTRIVLIALYASVLAGVIGLFPVFSLYIAWCAGGCNTVGIELVFSLALGWAILSNAIKLGGAICKYVGKPEIHT